MSSGTKMRLLMFRTSSPVSVVSGAGAGLVPSIQADPVCWQRKEVLMDLQGMHVEPSEQSKQLYLNFVTNNSGTLVGGSRLGILVCQFVLKLCQVT